MTKKTKHHQKIPNKAQSEIQKIKRREVLLPSEKAHLRQFLTFNKNFKEIQLNEIKSNSYSVGISDQHHLKKN